MEMIYTWKGTEEVTKVVEKRVVIPKEVAKALRKLDWNRHYTIAAELLQRYITDTNSITPSFSSCRFFLAEQKISSCMHMEFLTVESRVETRPVTHKLRIPDYIAEAIFHLCRAQKKVSAVKLLREHVIEKKGPGVIGLKESKDFIEQWYYENSRATLGDILAEALKGK